VRSLVVALVLVISGLAYAQMTDPPPRDDVKWRVELSFDESWTGRTIGVSWQRIPERLQGVLVLRRALPPGQTIEGRPIRAIDHHGPLLIPTFLYPSTKDVYHPAFDARSHAIPAGAQVGEWTVVAWADGDPKHPILDDVTPGTTYVYALIPATPGPDAGTYAEFGDAILTDSVTATASTLYKLRYVVVAGVTLVLAGIVLLVRRFRRRA